MMDIEDARDRLNDILTAAFDIRRLTHGIILEDYTANKDMVAAVERYLERLSEASRHVPDVLKRQHPHIPWRRIADLGNVLRHAYNQVSDERLWLATQNDVGPLAEAARLMLKDLDRWEGGDDATAAESAVCVASLTRPPSPSILFNAPPNVV